MIAAVRRFFRRFRPRVVHITLLDDHGHALFQVDEKTVAVLASLQGSGRMLDHKFCTGDRYFRLVLVVHQ